MILAKSGILLDTQLSFDMCCTVKVEIENKTQIYEENTNTMAIPIYNVIPIRYTGENY